MTDYKELIKSFTKEDYLSGRVNLHIHTNYSDGLAEFGDIVMQAKEKGYKYISITDHNTVNGHLDHPLYTNLIPRVEFDVWYKYIFLHLLAYGIDINSNFMKPFYSKNKTGTEKDIVRFFSRRNIKNLIEAIHKSGGIAVLAHPACCWALNPDKFIKGLKQIGLDGIEIYYPYPRWRKYIKFAQADEYEKLADKYNLIKTGGTDLHSKNL